MKNVLAGNWALMGVVFLGLAGCANTGQKTGAYVDDSWITTKVKSEIVANQEVSGRNIGVDTSKGIVTLTGTAATRHESNKAAEIARGIAGVKGVDNDIRVQ